MPEQVSSALVSAYQDAMRAKHDPPAEWRDGALVEHAQSLLASAVTRMHADDLAIDWTTWKSVKEPEGRAHRGTWRDIVGALRDSWPGYHYHNKAACPGWAPVRFANGRRHDSSVESICALALDCDDSGEWTRTLAVLSSLSIAYLAHRSPSHGIDGSCKWRLVVPLVAPVEGQDIEQWRAWYTAARVVIGAVGGVWFDPSCSNPSRLWYPPVRVGNLPPREVVECEGMALDLRVLGDAMRIITTQPAPPTLTLGERVRAEADRQAGHLRMVKTPLERARRWLEKRDPAISGSGGDHQTFVTCAAMVIDFALSEVDAFDALRDWNARCVPPWDDAGLRAKIAHAAKYGTGQVGSALDARPDTSLPRPSEPTWQPPRPKLEPEPDGPRNELGDVIKAKGPGNVKFPRLTEKGAVITCLENTEVMLKHYGVRCRYNLMTHEDEYELSGSTGAADKRSNTALAQVREWARYHGLAAGEPLDDHLTMIVSRNAYHPVADWIASKPWDGIDRLGELFDTLQLADTSEAHIDRMRRLLRVWAATAAKAALVPATAREGVAAQIVLVLQGPQGVRKTRWVQGLVPANSGWAREGVMLDPSVRDSVQQATNVWLVELGELDATFRKADIAALKAHLTARADTYRAAYARKAETIARRTVYAATVNERGFLHDATGSRRFGVLSVVGCDPLHGVDVQQFWAQMATLDLAECFLTPEDEAALVEANKGHETIDPMGELLAQAWEADDGQAPSWARLSEILDVIDGHRQWTSGDSKAIGAALRNRLRARTRVQRGYTQFAVRRTL